MNHRVIFKILTLEQWESFRAARKFLGAPVDLADGFIHFSTQQQVIETAEKHFGEFDELILAAVVVEPMGEQLKWEPSRGGQLFPHLYGVLHLEHVEQHWHVKKSQNGEHEFPDGF